MGNTWCGQDYDMTTKRKKYYAYKVPRTGEGGIVGGWSECEKKVKGEKDARFKGFPAHEDAEEWLKRGAGYTVKKKFSHGVYFDAGTGRGEGVEVSVTDEEGNDLLHEALPKGKINRFGKYLLGSDVTNNHGELLACRFAIEIAMKKKIKHIFGDSRLVIDYWSKGYMNMKDVTPETIELAYEVSDLRKDFERSGGRIAHIPGEDNPADLGFHR